MTRAADEIDAALERHFWLWAAVFVALLLACSIVRDVRAKMWIDELGTLHVARQASPGEIVKATLEGCDAMPPLYPIVVHAILPWVRHDALAVRLPATLGYCAMVLCLLGFCRRRLPAAFSLAAALLACNACLYYATEGRSYGIVLGCAAGALLCWQHAVDRRRRILAIPLLAFCLALMTAMHYYSVFFLAPLCVAEMVRWRRSGKPDFAVLAAMTPVLLVLGLHYPLIAAGARFREHFWSPAAWISVPTLYSSYFEEMCLLPLGLVALFSTAPKGRNALPAGLTLPEWVAMGAISTMPFCAVAFSMFATHVFVERYVLWAGTGIAVLVVAALGAVTVGRSAVGVSLLVFLAAQIAITEAHALRDRPALREAEGVQQELATLPDGPQPIVIADHHVFIELSYYAAPRLRERLIYPLSRDLDLRYFGTDTGQLVFAALSHRTNLHIIAYDAVLAAHPRFVLAAGTGDYLPWHLVMAGYRVVPIGSSVPPVLFEVEAPGLQGTSPAL